MSPSYYILRNVLRKRHQYPTPRSIYPYSYNHPVTSNHAEVHTTTVRLFLLQVRRSRGDGTLTELRHDHATLQVSVQWEESRVVQPNPQAPSHPPCISALSTMLSRHRVSQRESHFTTSNSLAMPLVSAMCCTLKGSVRLSSVAEFISASNRNRTLTPIDTANSTTYLSSFIMTLPCRRVVTVRPCGDVSRTPPPPPRCS